MNAIATPEEDGRPISERIHRACERIHHARHGIYSERPAVAALLSDDEWDSVLGELMDLFGDDDVVALESLAARMETRP